MIDINELRRLAQAATPGPWKLLPVGDKSKCFAVADINFLSVLTVVDECGTSFGAVYLDGDAKFIAAANPAVINELLDRLEEAESDALEQARLNGMGASREASLMAKLEAAEKSDAESIAMYRKARDERDALRAKVERMERQGPVAWQARTRPAWNDGTWGPWRKCSEEYAEDIKKTPLLHDWLYEARALYALPGAKALLRVPDTVMAALDSLDDYIARIEGNDRGACNHINLLRRYLLDATDVGENK